MNILGINAYHGDASAALFVEGQLVAAVEEERFTRVKHDTSFPHQVDPLLPRRGRAPTRGHRSLRAVPQPESQPREARRPRHQGPGGTPGREPARRQPPQDPERQADARRRLGGAGGQPEGQAPLRRAPPRTHRQQLLRFAVRTRRGPEHRRLRRHDQRDVGHRRRRPTQDPRRGRASPTRSACTTRPSPNSSGFPSTATSTR